MTATGTDRPMDQPMTRDEMAAWMRMRGVNDEAWLNELLERYEGWTEDRLDLEYEDVCGPMA